MGLSSALYTGLSGLDVNQTQLQVVGNNIANVNTTAFKTSRVLLQPQFYVTDGEGSPPDTNFGGTNPSQRGLGAGVAATEKDFSPGAIQPTGQPTDMAIDGQGFFVVKGADQLYTRDGAFSLNARHQLVTTNGDFVQGFTADANGNVAVGPLQNLTIPLGATTTARATTSALMQGNLNAAGFPASGASILLSQPITTIGGGAAPTVATTLDQLSLASDPNTALFAAGQTFTLAGQKGGRTLSSSSFTVQAGSTVQDLLTFYQQSLGIDTTVPASATAPTPGATLVAGAAPNAAELVIAGNTGSQNALEIPAGAFTSPAGATPLQFLDGANGGFTSNPTGESVHSTLNLYDTLGNPVSVDVTAVLESQSNAGSAWRFYVDSPDNKQGGLAVSNGTLTFNSTGKLVASTGTQISIDRTGTGSGTPLLFNIDFGTVTQFAGQGSTLQMTNQDGSAVGTLSSFSIGNDGTITGSFSNGLDRKLGQVALASFSNPDGLEDKGGNLFMAGAGSGAPVVGSPMQFGSGQIRAGSLEQSNVDISKEFINMIVASTGFSAASRVITTSDQLIQELLTSSR